MDAKTLEKLLREAGLDTRNWREMSGGRLALDAEVRNTQSNKLEASAFIARVTGCSVNLGDSWLDGTTPWCTFILSQGTAQHFARQIEARQRY